MKIIEEHEDSGRSGIDDDEERIIKGALSYSDKTAHDIMTPRTVVYALDINTILTSVELNKIKKPGLLESQFIKILLIISKEYYIL